MSKHKKQHFVAQSYLRAWCDPATPADQEPYVWRIAKDGTNARRKPPQKIFHESDLYTIPMPDGGRDLRLEHGLSQLEGEFIRIRDSKLEHHLEPDPSEHALLCAFVAATRARTPTQRDHLADVWGQVLAKANSVMEQERTATPAQSRAVEGLPRRSWNERERSFSYEDVQAMAHRPLQTSLAVTITTEAPLLAQLNMLVLTTTDPVGFITSDNPCVWFDPEAYKRPPFYQAPGLGDANIQITLPISPRQLLLLHGLGGRGHASISDHLLDYMNRRTRFSCAEYFVTNTNATRPIWFDPGEEPEDSWGKLHPESESRSE